MARSHGTYNAYKEGCRCDKCLAERDTCTARARERRALARQHGTYAMHRAGCRCEACVAANDAHCAEMRTKRKPVVRSHGEGRTYQHGCRCEACMAARAAEKLKQQYQYQDASSDKATRHRAEWTGPELEIAARTDLSNREVAAMLGRTFFAVNAKRKQLRSEPRDQWLAGKRGRLH
jgi:hypothetical protein